MRLQNRYEYNPTADKLADGSFAKVYHAFDTVEEKEVVLKFYHSLVVSPEVFRRNMERIKGLQHPHLVHLYDYLEMESIDLMGEVIVTRVGVWECVNHRQWESLSVMDEDVQVLSEQLMSALEYLHQLGIVHFDLTFENLLFVNNQQVKINNYGLMTASDAMDLRQFSPNILKYYSPEFFDHHYACDADKLGVRSDLWGLGLIYYKLKNDRFPIGEDEVLAEDVDASYLVLQSEIHIPDFLSPLDGAILKACLQKQATERVESVAALRSLIRRYNRQERLDQVLPIDEQQLKSRYTFDLLTDVIEHTDDSSCFRALDLLTDEMVQLEIFWEEASIAFLQKIDLRAYTYVFKLMQYADGANKICFAGIRALYRPPRQQSQVQEEPIPLAADVSVVEVGKKELKQAVPETAELKEEEEQAILKKQEKEDGVVEKKRAELGKTVIQDFVSEKEDKKDWVSVSTGENGEVSNSLDLASLGLEAVEYTNELQALDLSLEPVSVVEREHKEGEEEIEKNVGQEVEVLEEVSSYLLTDVNDEIQAIESVLFLRKKYGYDPSEDLMHRDGFVRVYRALDNVSKELVAIRFYSVTDLPLNPMLGQFKRFKHPNILRIYESYQTEVTDAFSGKELLVANVAEFVGGNTLAQLKGTDYVNVYRLFEDVLEGLAFLHQQGITYGALNPANIVKVGERYKLVEKVIDTERLFTSNSREGIYAPNSAYLAPEQLDVQTFGKEEAILPNVDLWALAVIFYEYYTNYNLFGEPDMEVSDTEIVSNVMHRDVTGMIEPFDAPYDTILRKCLVKKAVDRVASAAEVLAMLKVGGEDH